MSQQLRIENSDDIFLLTTKTIAGRLWFANNSKLHERILAFLAKYQEKYNVQIFAFILMANHYHLIARFPKCNKSSFMRSFNSIIAKLTSSYVAQFKYGKLWKRRYAEQVLPRNEDIEHWFMYCAVNPTTSGLVMDPMDYPSYNSFRDSTAEKCQTFKICRESEFNSYKRYNSKIRREDFEDHYTLKFDRLPGYEHLSAEEYEKQMLSAFEIRLDKEVTVRLENKQGFAGKSAVKNTRPGAFPKSTKTSERDTHRPIILTLCPVTRKDRLSKYFSIKQRHREASILYLNGDNLVQFPTGTYRPPRIN